MWVDRKRNVRNQTPSASVLASWLSCSQNFLASSSNFCPTSPLSHYSILILPLTPLLPSWNTAESINWCPPQSPVTLVNNSLVKSLFHSACQCAIVFLSKPTFLSILLVPWTIPRFPCFPSGHCQTSGKMIVHIHWGPTQTTALILPISWKLSLSKTHLL